MNRAPPRPRLALLLLGAVLSAAAGWAQTPELDAARDLYLAGKRREALAAFQKVAKTAATAEVKAFAHNNACVVLNELADFATARRECTDALTLRRQLDDPLRLGRTLNNLGLALQNLGQHGDARGAYLEALEINQKLGDAPAQAVNRGNLGLVAEAEGDYGAALDQHLQAEALAQQNSGAEWAAEARRVSWINQGVVLEKLGAFEAALDLYLRLEVEKDAMAPTRRASVLVNLGVLYRNLGDPILAIESFAAAAAIFEKEGDRAALSNVLLNLGRALHQNLGRNAEAESAYRRALALALESGAKNEQLQDLYQIGQLELEGERLEEAEVSFRAALDLAEQLGSPEGQWSAHYGLGLIAEKRARPEEALESYRRAIKVIEAVRSRLDLVAWRSSFFSPKRPVYAAAIEVLVGLGRVDQAFLIVQEAKARELRDALAEDGQAAVMTLPALNEVLKGRVLVEFFFGREHLFVFSLRDQRLSVRTLPDPGTLRRHTTTLWQALAAGKAAPQPELEALSAAFAADLKVENGRTLLIAPDQRLRYLPFDLLEIEGKALVESSTTVLLPSAATLMAPRTPRSRSGLDLIGFGDPEVESLGGRNDPRFSSLSLGPLPAGRAELENAARRLGGRSLVKLGLDARESALHEALASGQGTRVLHFATHAVVDEGPGRGAAILLTGDEKADGQLEPREIARLEAPTDLTILAACRSALGKDEDAGALGSLTGAFLASGSQAVLASLWDVDDAASAAFMEQFYFEIGRGKVPAEALVRVKRRFRADPNWRDPSLWAGWVLVGTGHPLATSPWRVVAPLGAALVVFLGAVWSWRRFRYNRDRVERSKP